VLIFSDFFRSQLNSCRKDAKIYLGEGMMEFAAAAAGTAMIIFPIGIWVGYRWRDRISRMRRAQHWVERWERERWIVREREAAAAAQNPSDDLS
jgi:hypothetical protein